MQEMVEFQKGPLAPETYRYADQDLISYFFHNNYPRSIHYLPAKWNMLKRIYVKLPKKWNLEDIIFIHYVGKKPWDVIETGYEIPHNLWRCFYFQAGGPDLNQE